MGEGLCNWATAVDGVPVCPVEPHTKCVAAEGPVKEWVNNP